MCLKPQFLAGWWCFVRQWGLWGRRHGWLVEVGHWWEPLRDITQSWFWPCSFSCLSTQEQTLSYTTLRPCDAHPVTSSPLRRIVFPEVVSHNGSLLFLIAPVFDYSSKKCDLLKWNADLLSDSVMALKVSTQAKWKPVFIWTDSWCS